MKLTRQEAEIAALNEIARLRLAVNEQLRRLEHARQRLDRVPQDRKAVYLKLATQEHFDPVAVAKVIDRIGIAEVWLVKNEAQFLIYAANGIHRMARLMNWATTGKPINSSIQKAFSRFEKVQPGLTHLRDLHEHMDEVMKGKGGAYSKLPDPDLESVIYNEENGDVIYLIGGQIFRIEPLAEAAVRLADELRDCYP
jgi:hypothetical protein